MLSGIIMSFYSVGAILWVIITKQIANPDNLKPDEIVHVHGKDEKFFSKDSSIVGQVPIMLRTLGFIFAGLIIIATITINKRVIPTISLSNLPVTEGFTQSNLDLSGDTSPFVNSLPNSLSPIPQRLTLKKIVERKKPPLRKFTVKKALLHRTFWHIFIMLMCSMAYTDFMKP
jgi:hypothetical protein